MKKEEAIELLDNLIGMIEDNQDNDYDEALKIGIKALENQKTIIEELEDIKAEIQDLDLGFVDEEYQAGVAYGIMKFNQILNKHIKENKQ